MKKAGGLERGRDRESIIRKWPTIFHKKINAARRLCHLVILNPYDDDELFFLSTDYIYEGKKKNLSNEKPQL